MTTALKGINKLTLCKKALAHNVSLLTDHFPNIMAIIKGNGYGTGALPLANALSELGITRFGVASVEEGIALRESGVVGDILVLYCPPCDAPIASEHHLEIAISNFEQIEALNRGKVHLHINTGMNRLGAKPDEAVSLFEAIKERPNLELKGVMTHLASAESPLCDGATREQLTLFRELLHKVDAPYIHALNSAGALRFTFPESNLVRMGLALFGLYGSEATKDILPLKCTLKLTSHLIHIQHCQKGDQVSYGGCHVVDRATPIGVVPLGYYDGIPLAHSGKSGVYIRDKPCPIVGAVTMDSFMCDLSKVPEVAIGDEVVLFNEEHRAETFANTAGRSVYELITCLGPRIIRQLR